MVGHHFLESYRTALSAIVKTQFGPRRLSDGEEGAVALAAALDLNATLVSQGLDIDSLRDPNSKPITVEKLRALEVGEGGRELPSRRPVDPAEWRPGGSLEGGPTPACALLQEKRERSSRGASNRRLMELASCMGGCAGEPAPKRGRQHAPKEAVEEAEGENKA